MSQTPFKYYNNRTKDLRFILSHLPERSTYLEPFGGSGAVLLARQRVKSEHYNDIDSNWYAFFKAARDHSDELLRRCLLTPFSEQEHKDAQEGHKSDNLIEQARLWYVNVTQSLYHNPYSGWSREYKRVNSHQTVRDELEPRWEEMMNRISGVYIHNADAMTIISRMAENVGEDLVIYCDPTFRNPSVHQRDRYELSDDEIVKLSALLHSVEGYVAISGPDIGIMNELYSDWHRWVPPEEKTNLTSDVINKGRKEALWTNQIYQQDTML